jgi:glycosyltransferase involved in cell wall biosynthesis
VKFLFILSEYLPESGGGIISYYGSILPGLVEAGHEIHVLVARADRMDLDDCEIGGVRVSYLKSDFLRNAISGFGRYKIGYPTFWAFLPIAWATCEQTRRGEGFDLVETTDFSLLFAPWVVAADAPPVNVSLHGSCGQLEWHDHPSRRTMDADLLGLAERAALSSAQAVQTNSDANAGFWRDLTHRDIRVLLPAFPVSDQAVVRSKPHTDGVVIGRLQIWKGPHVLCRALEAAPEARVRWIGRDVTDETGLPMSQTLREQYPQIFGTRLLHREGVSHIEALREIAEASFLCVPSTWDVFNLTVVEAMSLGTPVICSRNAGASMLIRHEENGFLFDPEKPSELAECIQRVLSLTKTERTNLMDKARSTVSQRMDPDRLRDERMDYYKSIGSNAVPKLHDEWLRAVFAPREAENERSEMLRAFTVKELIAATARQVVDASKRRLSLSVKG